MPPPSTALGARDVVSGPVAWRECGAADAPLMVLLHGLGGSRISWEPQLAALSSRFRVVAWDMPGYGDSASLLAPLRFPALVEAVVGLVDHLGAPTCHLAGISFGGMIAQYVAAAVPSRISSLALLATSPKFGLDGTQPDAWRAARLAPLDAGQQPADFAEVVLRGLAGPHISPEAFAEQLAAMGRISAAALRHTIDCLLTHDSRALLPSITAPTLCLVGELDRETPVAYSEAIAAAIPGATVTVVPRAGHLLNAEAPSIVNTLLEHHAKEAHR